MSAESSKKKEYFVGVPKDKELDEWIQQGLNVMLVGKHGVGKTHIIKNAFDRNKLKSRYFSAASMDPWTDFIGVPKERKDGDLSYLDFVLPKDFADDSVEALFFDEFNRAPKKVRNAVMELLQFKSINGRVFPNLKVVWTAINPPEDDDLDFDVEPLDPAQEDRFQIQIEIPYRPSLAYFQKTYGHKQGKAACDWWDGLSEDLKNFISPRRLDYALDHFQNYGNLRHVFPQNTPVHKLHDALQHGPPEETIRAFARDSNVEHAMKWLSHENNIEGVKQLIIEDDEIRTFVLPLLNAERAVALMSKNKVIKDEIMQHPRQYETLVREVAAGTQVKRFKNEFQALVASLDSDSDLAEGKDGIAGVAIRPVKKLPQHFTKVEQNHLRVNLQCKSDYDIVATDFKGDINAAIRETAQLSIKATNAWFRNKVYAALCDFVCDKMNKEQGIAVIRLCNFLADKSNSETLSDKNFDKLPLIYNTAVHCILQEDPKYPIEELYGISTYFIYKYFSKNTDKFPDNKDKLILELKPKKEWIAVQDEELEGIDI